MIIFNGEEITDENLHTIEFFRICGIPKPSEYIEPKLLEEYKRQEKPISEYKLKTSYGVENGNELFIDLLPENLLPKKWEKHVIEQFS